MVEVEGVGWEQTRSFFSLRLRLRRVRSRSPCLLWRGDIVEEVLERLITRGKAILGRNAVPVPVPDSVRSGAERAYVRQRSVKTPPSSVCAWLVAMLLWAIRLVVGWWAVVLSNRFLRWIPKRGVGVASWTWDQRNQQASGS